MSHFCQKVRRDDSPGGVYFMPSFNPMNFMKTVLAIVALVSGVSCSGSLPAGYSNAPGRSLVQGETTSNSRVLIRSVDDGAVLWMRGYNLGNKVWLEPGNHKVSVMCVNDTAYGSNMGGTEVKVQVQPGAEYLIKARPLKNPGDMPQADVVKVNR